MAGIEHRQTKSGPRWRVHWRQDGAKQERTYATLVEAGDFRAKVEAYGNAWPPGDDPRLLVATPGELTFGDWALQAIERRTRASERTKADYRRDLDKHLLPLLGSVPIRALTDEHVALWLADRRGSGMADKTVRNLHGFASSIVADALGQHPPLVSHNPFYKRMGDRSAVHTEEMCFLTPQEFETVLSFVRAEYVDLIRLLAGTGLRYGEATALTVRDINLLAKRKTLTVTKSWKRTGPKEYVVGEPKTPGSRRTLALSDELVELLIPLVASRRGAELVFPGAGGGRLPHSEVYKRGWAPAVARARVCDACFAPQRDGRNQVPRLPKPCYCDDVLDKTPRIHDLRHSHVSWLIADGISLPVISRRLGHSSITITFDRYGHLDPATDDAVNAAVDRALARR